MSSYGLTVESLSRAFDCAQSGNEEELASCWSLCGISYVEFYRRLHEFLKKWEKKPDTSVTSYNIADVTLKNLQAEVQDFQELVNHLTSQMTQQQAELSQIKLKTKQEMSTRLSTRF